MKIFVSVNLYGVFALMLILLKFAEVGAAAAWDWRLVLAPTLIPAALYAAHVAVTLLDSAISKVWDR